MRVAGEADSRTGVPTLRSFVAAGLVAALPLAADAGARPARPSAGPQAPLVSGPLSSERAVVRYRFTSSEAGVPPRRLRFLCAVDSSSLRPCRSTFVVRLASGVHTLRVRAVDPRGRRSPVTTVEIEILHPAGAEFAVGSQPLNVIAAAGRLWTENYGDGTVSIFDPATKKVTSVRVGGSPGGIAAGAGSVWVSDLGDGTLTRLDEDGTLVRRIPLGGRGAGVAVADGVVYVADYAGGLTRVDASTNHVVGRTKLPGQPEAVAVGFSRVWVTNGDGTVTALDPQTGAVDGAPIRVGQDADDVSIGTDAVWAVALYGKKLVRIDPGSRRVTLTASTPGQAAGVLATANAVWVSHYDRGTVARFDPARKRFVDLYRVGLEPRSLAAASGAVWVVNQASGSISRVGH